MTKIINFIYYAILSQHLFPPSYIILPTIKQLISRKESTNTDIFIENLSFFQKNLNHVAKNDTPLPLFLQKIQKTIKFYYYERRKGRKM